MSAQEAQQESEAEQGKLPLSAAAAAEHEVGLPQLPPPHLPITTN